MRRKKAGDLEAVKKQLAALADALFDRFRIYAVAIDTGPVKGTRVTPHLYTTTAELDALVKAIKELAAWPRLLSG
jgi:selenocysteine lyase/cysteine desulfurase